LAAVHCAGDVQNELAQANDSLEKHRRMHFRIGINVGDVMVKEGDIFGDGVNIAARLEVLAEPSICISRGIHDHVMKKLPYEFEDIGEQSVKNIAHLIRIFRLILDGPKSEFRPSESAPPVPDVEVGIPSVSETPPAILDPDSQAVEIEFWDSIKNSIRASEYEAYLEQYP
jgi:adenylate cyclase